MQVADTPQVQCPNCKNYHTKGDKFCRYCGQENTHIKIPFKHFVLEFLEGTIHFDNKIWFTLKHILVNPGNVIKDFNNNIRAKYVPPIRLYVFVSFVYFILISSGVSHNVDFLQKQIAKNELSDSAELKVNFTTNTKLNKAVVTELTAIKDIDAKKVDVVLKKHQVKTDAFNNVTIAKLIALRKGELNAEKISHQFISTISKLIFVLMPLFAFLVWLVCGRRKLYFSETLIFSLYLHATFFLLQLIFWPAKYWPWLNELSGTFIFIIGAYYLVASIKTSFQQTWFKAIIKSILLFMLYGFFFFLAFLGAILASVFI